MKIIGLTILIIGIMLIGYGMSLAGNFDIENRYLVTKGSIGFGFILSIIGGYILIPKGTKLR